MADKTLLAIIELGGYPDFRNLYKSLGYDVLLESSMRKAISLLKKKGDRLSGANRSIQVDIVRDSPGLVDGIIICLPEVVAVYRLIFFCNLTVANPI